MFCSEKTFQSNPSHGHHSGRLIPTRFWERKRRDEGLNLLFAPLWFTTVKLSFSADENYFVLDSEDSPSPSWTELFKLIRVFSFIVIAPHTQRDSGSSEQYRVRRTKTEEGNSNKDNIVIPCRVGNVLLGFTNGSSCNGTCSTTHYTLPGEHPLPNIDNIQSPAANRIPNVSRHSNERQVRKGNEVQQVQYIIWTELGAES